MRSILDTPLFSEKSDFQFSPTYTDPLNRRAGLEIELENTPGGDSIVRRFTRMQTLVHVNCWEVVGDGSLRDGVEIRTTGRGIPHQECMQSLLHLGWAFESNRRTFRDGIHYNGDVGDFTRKHLLLLILFASMLSDSIFKISGSGRKYSNFCVPWRYCTGYLFGLIDDLLDEDCDYLMASIHAMPKYTEMNLNSIESKGCVEFRHLKTPFIEVDYLEEGVGTIARYSNVCHGLLTAARHRAYDHLDIKQSVESFYECVSAEVISREHRTRHLVLRHLLNQHPITGQCILDTTSLLTHAINPDSKKMDTLSLVKTVLQDKIVIKTKINRPFLTGLEVAARTRRDISSDDITMDEAPEGWPS